MNKGPVTGTTIYRPRMPMTNDELEGWTILGEYMREPGNYSRRGMCVEMHTLANHQRISYTCEALMQRRLRKYMTDQGKVADTEYLFPVEDLNSRILVVEKFKRDIALNRTLPAPPTDSTTSPVTPTAVPEAVWNEIRDVLNEIESACYDRDQEIARLATELAVAQADTARLDWLSQPRDRIAFGINKADNIPGCSLYVGEGCYEPFDAATLREAIDAARAAGDEGPGR